MQNFQIPFWMRVVNTKSGCHTIKTNMLPDVVEYLYYQHEGWLPLVFGNDERSIHGNYAVYYVLSMEGGR